MTPAALIVARDAHANATATARTLWSDIGNRTEEAHAEVALDLVAAHVGQDVELPDSVLRESVVRCALFLDNTLGPNESFGIGLKSFKTDDMEFQYQSEFLGSALRRSGSMGLLAPWVRRRARLVT